MNTENFILKANTKVMRLLAAHRLNKMNLEDHEHSPIANPSLAIGDKDILTRMASNFGMGESTLTTMPEGNPDFKIKPHERIVLCVTACRKFQGTPFTIHNVLLACLEYGLIPCVAEADLSNEDYDYSIRKNPSHYISKQRSLVWEAIAYKGFNNGLFDQTDHRGLYVMSPMASYLPDSCPEWIPWTSIRSSTLTEPDFLERHGTWVDQLEGIFPKSITSMSYLIDNIRKNKGAPKDTILIDKLLRGKRNTKRAVAHHNTQRHDITMKKMFTPTTTRKPIIWACHHLHKNGTSLTPSNITNLLCTEGYIPWDSGENEPREKYIRRQRQRIYDTMNTTLRTHGILDKSNRTFILINHHSTCKPPLPETSISTTCKQGQQGEQGQQE